MKTLFDHQCFDMQNFGGISRIFSIFFQYLKQENISFEMPLKYNDNEHLKEVLPEIAPVYHSKAHLPYYFHGEFSKSKKAQRRTKINRKHQIETLKNKDFDVFIPTYYDPYFLDYLINKPFLLFVHDMIHEIMSKPGERDEQLIENKKLLIEKANRIIAVSENTKRDILTLYPKTDAKKISVVHLAANVIGSNEPIASLPKKYLLYVGNRDWYKNFQGMLTSIQPFLENTEFQLVCAGGGDFRSSERKLIKELNLKDKILHFPLQEHQMKNLYANAFCFIFPSLYEGFGIPVLEAMQSGCPVVLGKHSSFPEVAGEAALFYDIANEKSILKALSTLRQSEEFRKNLIEKGFQQANQFSWKKTCENILSEIKTL